MHLQKNLHGGLRGEKRGWWLKVLLRFYPRNSIGVNHRGYSGCSGLEKDNEKLEKMKVF